MRGRKVKQLKRKYFIKGTTTPGEWRRIKKRFKKGIKP